MTANGVGHQAERQVRRARANPVVRGLARAGFVASGLIQLLVGIITIEVALHRSSSSADQSGALSDLAKAPGGPVLLWVVTVGSFALALWLVIAGALERGEDKKGTWGRRIRDWAKALVYAAVGLTALRFAMGGTASSAGSARRGSQDLLAAPGGPVLLGLVGLGVVVLGAFLVHRGAAKRFVKTIRVPSGAAGRATIALGQVGYIARGVAVGAVGVLLVVAAFTADPKRATGLDGALKAFAALPFGAVLLVLIGLGWIAGGVYTIIRAKQAVLD
ncbi:DUF1206 domain-containing protein [Amnibacterium sp.]|uniref:DUF1206 domain-containing protein n=1 Tax=Amnibacterium sp. TaxID=1872496 RepID=UPI0026255350|nr:DUF1206 domain-containing protein [Amnibacterium sp.]MCU1474372.1 hypothetical protein [Amnibacterium sp.]